MSLGIRNSEIVMSVNTKVFHENLGFQSRIRDSGSGVKIRENSGKNREVGRSVIIKHPNELFKTKFKKKTARYEIYDQNHSGV